MRIPTSRSLHQSLQPPVEVLYNLQKEEPLCNRVFNLHNPQGRQELRFIYFFFLALLLLGITGVTGWYFISAEIDQRESTRVILLFSCSLGFVVFSSISSYLVTIYTDEPDLSRTRLSEAEYKVEYEKRVYFLLNLVVLALYVAVLALAYNLVLEGLNVFLSIFCFILYQYSVGRMGLELHILFPRAAYSRSSRSCYIFTAIFFTCLSLLGTALSLVDFSSGS
jgi:hypothetical protein